MERETTGQVDDSQMLVHKAGKNPKKLAEIIFKDPDAEEHFIDLYPTPNFLGKVRNIVKKMTLALRN